MATEAVRSAAGSARRTGLRAPSLRGVRPLVTLAGLLGIWQLVVLLTDVPPFILPAPMAVIATLIERWPLILGHASITAAEILLGFAVGALLGVASGLLLASFATARRWSSAGP
jgi:putative hydroxymethylpyrimidine transport system permease protein